MANVSQPSVEFESEIETKEPDKLGENSEKSNLATSNEETRLDSPSQKTLDAGNSRPGFSYGNFEEQKTPEKSIDDYELEIGPEVEALCAEEGGLISEIEQARLFLAATKTLGKGANKTLRTTDGTPDKQSTPGRKRSQEESATTPGKFRRVELITLSSPKVKI